MITQIENTPQGYLVGCYLRDGNGDGHWHRLRNFGPYQGDAIEYRDIDVPELSDIILKATIKAFDISKIYKRIGKGKYRAVID